MEMTFIIAYFALLSEVMVVVSMLAFLGVLSSKYYDQVKFDNENRFNTFMMMLMIGTLFLSKYLLSLANFPALLTLHLMFHGAVLISLTRLNRKFSTVKLTYKRQRNIAACFIIASWTFELIAIVATIWWFHLLIANI